MEPGGVRNMGKSRANLCALAMALAVYLFLGTLYAAYTPLWMPYDEPFHFKYVETLKHERRLPVMSENYEAYQPPLYYLYLVPFRLAGDNYHAVAVTLRLATLALSALVIVGMFYSILEMDVAGAWGAFAACGMMSLVPMVLSDFASINNEVAVSVFGAFVFLLFLRGLARGPSLALDAAIGVLTGLALLSKPTGLFLIPTFFVYVFLTPGGGARRSVLRISVFSAALFAVCGFWYVRNIAIYGDLIGHSAIVKIIPGEVQSLYRPVVFARWFAFVYAHFWMFNNFLRNDVAKCPLFAYLIFVAAGAMAFAGVFREKIVAFGKLSSARRRAFILMICAILFSFASLIYQNTKQFAMEGRYLYPALVPIFILFYEGHKNIMPARFFRVYQMLYVAGFALLNLYFVWHMLAPAPEMPFKPPF
jgi:4-amino-4-deoxy-L-arabinose transferase-like glycosyltransferase